MSLSRLTIVSLAIASLATALPAGASTKGRTVTLAYEGTSSVQGVVSGKFDTQAGSVGYVKLATSRKERTVSVSVTDARGLPVAFQLSQTPSATGTPTDIGEWCVSTPHPVRLPHPGELVLVYVELGVCGTSPSVPTTGTVKLTLH